MSAVSGPLHLDKLPIDFMRSILPYLDERTILATAAICRNLRDDRLLSSERPAAATRLRREIAEEEAAFPQILRDLLQQNYRPTSQLPRLDIGGRRQDYITFIRGRQMREPVMRFRDRFGRPGVAIQIQATPSIIRRRALWGISSSVRYAIRTRDLAYLAHTIQRFGLLFLNWNQSKTVIYTLFQRYTDSRQWVSGWGDSNNAIEELYSYRDLGEERNRVVSTSCITTQELADLLAGRDSDFTLPPAARESTRFSHRTIVVTALAALALSYLAHYYLHQS